MGFTYLLCENYSSDLVLNPWLKMVTYVIWTKDWCWLMKLYLLRTTSHFCKTLH